MGSYTDYYVNVNFPPYSSPMNGWIPPIQTAAVTGVAFLINKSRYFSVSIPTAIVFGSVAAYVDQFVRGILGDSSFKHIAPFVATGAGFGISKAMGFLVEDPRVTAMFGVVIGLTGLLVDYLELHPLDTGEVEDREKVKSDLLDSKTPGKASQSPGVSNSRAASSSSMPSSNAVVS